MIAQPRGIYKYENATLRIPPNVWLNDSIGHGAILLYGALCIYAHDTPEGAAVYIESKDMGRMIGAERGSIMRWLGQLEAAGLIRRVDPRKPTRMIYLLGGVPRG